MQQPPICHSYNPASGELTTSQPADQSPLEPGVWLLPANATLEPRPEHGPDDFVWWDRITERWGIRIDALRHERETAAQADADTVAAREAEATHPEVVKRRLAAAVQSHMDTTAQAWGYTNMAYAVTYADEPVVLTFALEGKALRAWRSLVWERCYQVMAAVAQGARAIPTEAELIAQLPTVIRP